MSASKNNQQRLWGGMWQVEVLKIIIGPGAIGTNCFGREERVAWGRINSFHMYAEQVLETGGFLDSKRTHRWGEPIIAKMFARNSEVPLFWRRLSITANKFWADGIRRGAHFYRHFAQWPRWRSAECKRSQRILIRLLIDSFLCCGQQVQVAWISVQFNSKWMRKYLESGSSISHTG